MKTQKETGPKVSRAEGEVLMLLVNDEQYGLQLVDASQGRIKRGSVYVLLGRLEEKKLVVSRAGARPAVEGGLPRRLYRLTATGRRVAGAWEASTLALLSRAH